MALVIASTTSSQADLDHASSEDWRDSPPPQPEEQKAPTNADPLEKVDQKTFNEIRNQEEISKRSRHRGGESKRIGQLTRQKYELLEKLSKYESLDSLNLTPTERRRLEEKRPANSDANGGNAAPASSATQRPATQTSNGNAAPHNAAQPAEQSQREQGQAEALTPHQQNMARGRSKYADFDAAMAEADRRGFELPTEESIEVLKNLPNSSDVMYRLAKDHQLREQISANPEQSVEILRQVSAQEQQQAQSADALDPKPEEDFVSVSTIPAAGPKKFDPDAFPKLKIRYGPDPAEERKLLSRLSGEKAVDFIKKQRDWAASAWIIVNNPNEELPFHSWRTEPMERLEKLKAEDVPQYQPPRKNAVA